MRNGEARKNGSNHNMYKDVASVIPVWVDRFTEM